MPKLKNSDIEAQAVQIVQEERTTWESATAFITDRVAFNMRNLIRQLRKNYWGVFDQPTDPITGKKKTWIPLTQSLVESVVKNIDLDTKDINFRAKNPNAIGLTRIVRAIVKNYLDTIGFGEKLDMLERDVAIDGTAVWKTLEALDPETRKTTLQIRRPDLLNLYIDPTAESIRQAYRFTERCLMTLEEIQRTKGWTNTDNLKAVTGLANTDSGQNAGSVSSTSKYRDVWEMWGAIPEYLITGNDKNTDDIEGRIIVSGLEAGTPTLHLLERNPGIRPYEEAWYTRVSNRWYGMGIAEKVMPLQVWINTIVNLRINRATVSQLGLFKLKKGSGITAQILQRLSSNGAIQVNSMDDIEQLVVQEPGQGSYTDEENANTWAQKVTGAFEAVTGEGTPASTSATATAIQNTNGQTQFTLIKEGIGMFLQRWVKRQALPIIMKRVKKEDLIRTTGDADELRELDDLIVNTDLANELERMNFEAEMGLPSFVNPMQVMQERDNALGKLQKSGEDRYVKLLHDIDPTEYDVEVFVTNEEIDKGVLSQNLLTLIQAAPQYAEELTQDLMDVMGLPFAPKKPEQMMMPGMPGMPGAQPGMVDPMTQNPQQVVQQANEIA